MRQEHQVGALNNCISELQQQAHAQRLELQDAQHGYIESRQEQSRLQEELSMKEKVLRDTQIRRMHEMGEMKRAQEREIQEVESNCSGRLSYVSSQPAAIPSSRSMLSRDKRLPLDTWNTSGLQENVLG